MKKKFVKRITRVAVEYGFEMMVIALLAAWMGSIVIIVALFAK